MTFHHVILYKFPNIGLAGKEGETADEVAARLQKQTAHGLATLSLERFKQMCEIREMKEDPSKKFLRTKVLQKVMGLQELEMDFGDENDSG